MLGQAKGLGDAGVSPSSPEGVGFSERLAGGMLALAGPRDGHGAFGPARIRISANSKLHAAFSSCPSPLLAPPHHNWH